MHKLLTTTLTYVYLGLDSLQETNVVHDCTKKTLYVLNLKDITFLITLQTGKMNC